MANTLSLKLPGLWIQQFQWHSKPHCFKCQSQIQIVSSSRQYVKVSVRLPLPLVWSFLRIAHRTHRNLAVPRLAVNYKKLQLRNASWPLVKQSRQRATRKQQLFTTWWLGVGKWRRRGEEKREREGRRGGEGRGREGRGEERREEKGNGE